MRLSKEVRIGLLATASIVVFFVGFYLLKGADVFSREKEYKCFYDNIQGLQSSSVVEIRGLNVGHVSKTQLVDGKGVMVTITVSRKVEIPKGTIAILASGDLLGAKVIKLQLGTGPGIVKNGETLQTSTDAGIIDAISTQINPLIKQVDNVVEVLDSVMISVNNIVGVNNQQGVANAIVSIQGAAKDLSGFSKALNKESGEVTNIIHNANSVTTNLANNNDKVQHILTNFDKVSGQLADGNIKQTLADLQKTSANLQEIINKVNTNQGSLGKLVNDKELYNNLNSSLKTLDSLMTDIKAHPTRYINVTIFGKKKS